MLRYMWLLANLLSQEPSMRARHWFSIFMMRLVAVVALPFIGPVWLFFEGCAVYLVVISVANGAAVDPLATLILFVFAFSASMLITIPIILVGVHLFFKPTILKVVEEIGHQDMLLLKMDQFVPVFREWAQQERQKFMRGANQPTSQF